MYNKKILVKNIYNLTKHITPERDRKDFFFKVSFCFRKNHRFDVFFPVLLDIVRKRLYNTIE